MGEIEGFADDGCMELREEQAQMIKKGEEEKKVLEDLAIFEAIIADQRLENKKGKPRCEIPD